jgi:hypothetical protein
MNGHSTSTERLLKQFRSIAARLGERRARSMISAERRVTETDPNLSPESRAKHLRALDQIERELLDPGALSSPTSVTADPPSSDT